jgi:hypothetical protein
LYRKVGISYINTYKLRKDIWGMNLRDLFICFVDSAIMLSPIGIIYSGHVDAKKQTEYEERVRLVCSCVEKNFDSNSNGMIDPDEAVKLARAVGYDRMFPTNQPVTRLEPGSYSRKDVKLVLSGSGSYGDVHRLAASEQATPAWSVEFRFPESKLESLRSSSR